MGVRDTSRDGFGNRLEFFAMTHFKPLWKVVQAIPPLRTWANKFLINRAINKTKARPYPLSTRSDYSSWDSLTDRTFSGRHLPPADDAFMQSLPPLEKVVEAFRRPAGGERLSNKSTLLFSHFAQWFTDGFLRTDREDHRKNTSNHDIDLSPLYGIKPAHTDCLRSRQGGRLKSQMIGQEEYPPYYFGSDGNPLPEFVALPLTFPKQLPPERKQRLFAMGVDRANNQIGYVMFNTLFLREHNRIAGELQKSYPSWDDERLFQTARATLIVLLIKIVVEEYINHIAPYHFKFRAEPSSFWKEPWYRTNWMTVEFNLLYRWHALVTDQVKCGDQKLPVMQTVFNSDLLTSRGLAAWFHDASTQPAGDVGLFNTTALLLDVEKVSAALARETRLRGYNDYRAEFGYPRVTSFDQISSRDDVRAKLQELYGDVDKIELFVGLFAEDVREGSALPALIGRMVGVDAFSQALTNPLLSMHVFNERTFSPVGWRIIQETGRLLEIVKRNVPSVPSDLVVTMTQL